MGMIVNCAAYREGRRIRDIDIAEISDVLAEPDTFVWLGLLEPDEQLLREVQGEFGLHDLAIEDAHRAHQRPKLDTYGDSLFLVLHTAQVVDGETRFGETHLFVGRRYIVSVRHGPSLSYAEVRKRCEKTPELLAKGPDFVLYAIMDFVVDNYIPIVDTYEDELTHLEDAIFIRSGTVQTTERLYALKRELLALRRAISPVTEICASITRIPLKCIDNDIHPYFRDVADHVVRMLESMDQMRELLTTALQVNLAMISIAQNDVVKKLAGWGAILAIPTLVASIYGMNFHHMPELDWRFGYPLVIGITITICAVLYRRLRRAEWL